MILVSVIFVATIPFLGFGMAANRWIRKREILWGALFFNLMVIHWLAIDLSPLSRMFLLTTGLLLSCKNIGMFESGQYTTISWQKKFLFYYAWIGVNPRPFARTFKQRTWNWNELILAFGSILLGVGFLAIFLFLRTNQRYSLLASYLLLLPGLSLIFHFGILRAGLVIWERFGVSYSHFFQNPFKFQSLHDFWSRRWNFPYVEMLSLIFVRPLLKHCSGTTIHFLSFLFSGILHEIAITLPIQSGFGGPTAYFLFQGLMVWFEKKYELKDRWGAWYKPVAVLSLVLLVPLLFPPKFVSEVLSALVDRGVQAVSYSY